MSTVYHFIDIKKSPESLYIGDSVYISFKGNTCS